MLHYRQRVTFICIFFVIGLLFVFSGCAKQPTNTAEVKQKQANLPVD